MSVLEKVFDVIQNNIKPTTGVVLLVAGALALYAWGQGWVPDNPYIAIAAMIAIGFVCLGAAILIALVLAAIGAELRATTAKLAGKTVARRKLADRKAEALKNLSILTDEENQAMLWVFTRGTQRFSASRRNNMIIRLQRKLIVDEVSGSVEVFEIPEYVWAEKDAFVTERSRHLRVPTIDPFSHSWVV